MQLYPMILNWVLLRFLMVCVKQTICVLKLGEDMQGTFTHNFVSQIETKSNHDVSLHQVYIEKSIQY